jgi:uncharacterized protein
MLRDLEYLLNVQEIDLKIHEQELAKEQLPATVGELEQTIQTAEKSTEIASKKLEEAEKDLASFEDQIRQAQEGLEKSQTRLNSIKTNREYDAVHAEIEAAKNILASSENRKKKLTDEISQLKTALETARQECEKIKAENSPKIADLRTKIDAIDSVIASIVKEREAVTPSISKAILRSYNLIRKSRKHGKVISAVNEERTCTVCFKVLEPQLVNEIKRSTKIIMCQNCGSIFVWTGKAKAAGPTPSS